MKKTKMMDLEDFEIEDVGFADEDGEFLDTILPLPKQLNNADLNLDSPLMTDEVENFIKFMLDQPYSTLFQKPSWTILKNYPKVINPQVLTAKGFHRWIGLLLSRPLDYTDGAVNLLEAANSQASITWEIPAAFIKKLGGQGIDYKSFGRSPVSVGYLQLFLECYELTITMATDLNPPDEVFESGNSAVIDRTTDYVVIQSKNLGRSIITKNYWILGGGIVVTKNHLLMLKDLLLARFQTLFSMENRIDKKFDPWDIQKLEQFYQAGDRVLTAYDNLAYDTLKMVEPLCILKLSEIARSYRPLIPKLPDFESFLAGELVKIKETQPEFMKVAGLIDEQTSHEVVLQFFGCYRHWGHPNIDYFGGLKQLHAQVTLKKTVDDELAQAIASDLAKLVLKSNFKRHKTWAVDKKLVPVNHVLYPFISNNTWPTPAAEADVGDVWHKLPLIRCFDIPDLIDPAAIYSDKAHSIYYSELLDHIRNRGDSRIPTRRVLSTFLSTPARNWPRFLKEIDEQGLPQDALIIGLRAKERELKRQGRFFALMSWELREYFVVTEYLIKEHFVPLFNGLTMADDLTGVIQKMLRSTRGHGHDDYTSLTISNHLDYSKWNNHQRKESNKYVFEVMGKFLGYPNLIARTHEFFEKSLVYFCNRPDLMCVHGNEILNRNDDFRVCWQGQLGGLEGLRQKGWSIVNLLLILRVSEMRNTEVRILAQGDNQVLNMHYKLPPGRDDEEIRRCIDEIITNNNAMMENVRKLSDSLGLIINQDETVQSCDFLVYGKVPIFRGNVLIPESKRWSRINCLSNDQLPGYRSVLSTVGSTALGVSHFSGSYIDPLIRYNFFFNLSRNLLEKWNPILNADLRKLIKTQCEDNIWQYWITAAYLDPSLGGICGVNPARFLIRGFPDPITEGLSFWKFVSTELRPHVRRLALTYGDPAINEFRIADFPRLLEDPMSLNIPGPTSAQMIIRNEVKNIIREKRSLIKNEIIGTAIDRSEAESCKLEGFLLDVKPRFPRFLSEFKAATFVGLSESLVGLYENSKTIRIKFLAHASRDLSKDLIHSERTALEHLLSFAKTLTEKNEWECSSLRADYLRKVSWGPDIIGATIPHPLELLGIPKTNRSHCLQCPEGKNDYVVTVVDGRSIFTTTSRGMYPPYLGSRTTESTSIFNPWEREVRVPLIRRAVDMRRCLNWFVKLDSVLGKSIFANIKSITGQDLSASAEGFLRTGSALHRFSSSRQQAGGYASVSPSTLSRMFTTTDKMSDIGQKNYDFMYQSLILYAQTSTLAIADLSLVKLVHHHISCQSCIREIDEVMLDSEIQYSPLDYYDQIRFWLPDELKIIPTAIKLPIPTGEWKTVSQREGSYHIGRAVGFLFGETRTKSSNNFDDSALFPLTIREKVTPETFLAGILEGLAMAASLDVLHRRNVVTLAKPWETFAGCISNLIHELSMSSPLQALMSRGPLHVCIVQSSHRVPPSYPLNASDSGSVIRHFFKTKFYQDYKDHSHKFLYYTLWIFADLISSNITGPFLISRSILSLLTKTKLMRRQSDFLRKLREAAINFRNPDKPNRENSTNGLQYPQEILNQVFICESEVRHAVKDYSIVETKPNDEILKFGRELVGHVRDCKVLFLPDEGEKPPIIHPPRYSYPLISGLRSFQCATGAHYKLRCLLARYNITYRDFLCGGDGSGGLTSCLLRWQPDSKGIFNSLLDLRNINLRGSRPAEPSAVSALGHRRFGCVNLESVWEHPSDLSQTETWRYFKDTATSEGLNIDLIVLDMERVERTQGLIIKNLVDNVPKLLQRGGTLIYKSYVWSLINKELDYLVIKLGRCFDQVYIAQTEFSSSFTSEIYLVFTDYGETHLRGEYLDMYSLWSYLQDCYCYKNMESELKRFRRCSEYDFFVGVPKVLIPELRTELSTLLESAGLYSGTASVLAHDLVAKPMTEDDRFKFIITVAAGSIFHFTEDINKIVPPSDQKLLKFLSLLFGLLMVKWGVSEAVAESEKLRDVIASDCYISFCRFKKKEKEGTYLRVRLDNSKYFTKRLRLISETARIGQTVRLYLRLRSETRTGNVNLTETLKKYNIKFDERTLERHSDFFNPQFNNQVRDCHVSSVITMSTNYEAEAVRD
uniref:Replicase n=1 Tax=Duck rhabdovirus TaxID=2212761 RepID=A0A3G1RPC3_9RHAB|nr:MAG: RNA-dependent RNA polymerase [Duck rhabdovirus]